VIAEQPAQFNAWWSHQLASAHDDADFNAHCGSCHAVRGAAAQGSFGPDLSHLIQRSTIASGVLPNDDTTLAHWVADPQGLKPGNLMPVLPLSQTERNNILSYLKTLN
jgi:cytochrome c oxidase subunit 2